MTGTASGGDGAMDDDDGTRATAALLPLSSAIFLMAAVLLFGTAVSVATTPAPPLMTGFCVVTELWLDFRSNSLLGIASTHPLRNCAHPRPPMKRSVADKGKRRNTVMLTFVCRKVDPVRQKSSVRIHPQLCVLVCTGVLMLADK